MRSACARIRSRTVSFTFARVCSRTRAGAIALQAPRPRPRRGPPRHRSPRRSRARSRSRAAHRAPRGSPRRSAPPDRAAGCVRETSAPSGTEHGPIGYSKLRAAVVVPELDRPGRDRHLVVAPAPASTSSAPSTTRAERTARLANAEPARSSASRLDANPGRVSRRNFGDRLGARARARLDRLDAVAIERPPADARRAGRRSASRRPVPARRSARTTTDSRRRAARPCARRPRRRRVSRRRAKPARASAVDAVEPEDERRASAVATRARSPTPRRRASRDAASPLASTTTRARSSLGRPGAAQRRARSPRAASRASSAATSSVPRRSSSRGLGATPIAVECRRAPRAPSAGTRPGPRRSGSPAERARANSRGKPGCAGDGARRVRRQVEAADRVHQRLRGVSAERRLALDEDRARARARRRERGRDARRCRRRPRPRRSVEAPAARSAAEEIGAQRPREASRSSSSANTPAWWTWVEFRRPSRSEKISPLPGEAGTDGAWKAFRIGAPRKRVDAGQELVGVGEEERAELAAEARAAPSARRGGAARSARSPSRRAPASTSPSLIAASRCAFSSAISPSKVVDLLRQDLEPEQRDVGAEDGALPRPWRAGSRAAERRSCPGSTPRAREHRVVRADRRREVEEHRRQEARAAASRARRSARSRRAANVSDVVARAPAARARADRRASAVAERANDRHPRCHAAPIAPRFARLAGGGVVRGLRRRSGSSLAGRTPRADLVEPARRSARCPSRRGACAAR